MFFCLETLHYEALCREEVKQPELYCYYHTGSQDDYWLRLGPVRTEVLNENPRIVRFYEVIHDWEIKHIRSISQNVMERSQVLDKGARAKSYESKVFHIHILYMSAHRSVRYDEILKTPGQVISQ